MRFQARLRHYWVVNNKVRMKMHPRNLLTHTVLLAFFAGDRTSGGSWTTAWTKAPFSAQSEAHDAFFRRCPAGIVSCPRVRYGLEHGNGTLRHEGHFDGAQEVRLSHTVSPAAAEGRTNKAVKGLFKVVTVNAGEHQGNIENPVLRPAETTVTRQPCPVMHPRHVFEEQAANRVGDAIDCEISRAEQGTLQPARGPDHGTISRRWAPERWREVRENNRNSHEGEMHGSREPHPLPEVAFVLLNRDANPLSGRVLRGTAGPKRGPLMLHCNRLTKTVSKSNAQYVSPRWRMEFRKASLETCLSGLCLKPPYMKRDDVRSFLHDHFLKTVPGDTTVEGTREVARLVKEEYPRRIPSASSRQTFHYVFLQPHVGGEDATGKVNQGTRHYHGSSSLPSDASYDRWIPRERRRYDYPDDDAELAGAYSLIHLWGEASQQPSGSEYHSSPWRSTSDVYSRMQIREHNSLLDHDSQVTITYHFPFYTAETQSIAFVLVALPPGYAVRESGELCRTSDVKMPALLCRIRHVEVPERQENLEASGTKRTIFVQVSSADPGRELPLGTHSFSVWVHNPAHRLAVGLPKNWWFVTFRFTPGHTVTKHFENGLLHEKRKCAWTSWRQETPCSASCGPGFEMWTRSLLAGDEGACGPETVKRKCELVPCNINCQLGPWETVIDCTKPCLAQKATAFQLSIRKVFLDKQGLGISCKELYPWNSKLQQGWSDKLRLVIRRTPCGDIFSRECPTDIGCRVERRAKRTITVAYPWGSCPFPCGGVGFITSIVQVANGIPRWIGERDSPTTFQVPCRADKEPIVTRQPCNTFACEDCSVYMETPTHDRVAKAWFFFLPSQEADTVIVTVPPGVTFALASDSTPTDYHVPEAAPNESERNVLEDKPPLHHTSENVQTSPPSEKSRGAIETAVSSGSLLPGPTPEQNLDDIITEPYRWEEADLKSGAGGEEGALPAQSRSNPCRHLRASFGQPSRCDVRASARYQLAQEIVLHLEKHIIPPYNRPIDRQSQQRVEDEIRKSKRPEWLVVPLRVSDGAKERSSFHLWLMSSHSPRDPEVFTCQVRTPLHAPVACQYKYFPVQPQECDKCHQQSNRKILMLRRFYPPKYGGACNVPQEQWQLDVVLVISVCTKGCAAVKDAAQRTDFSTAHLAAGVQIKDTGEPSFSRFRFDDRQHLMFEGASGIQSVLSFETLREPSFSRQNPAVKKP